MVMVDLLAGSITRVFTDSKLISWLLVKLRVNPLTLQVSFPLLAL